MGRRTDERSPSSAVPNAIAALLLYLRDQTGTMPHIYFEWVDGNPVKYLLRFILFGEGDVPLVTRKVLRKVPVPMSVGDSSKSRIPKSGQ